MSIKPFTLAVGAVALMALAAPSADAEERHGVTTINVPANADVVVTYPFNREPVGEFETSGRTSATLTLAGSPGFTANELVDTHYVRIIDGAGAGLWSTITANGANTVTIDSAVANVMDSSDQTVRIYEHHTVGSVFPDEDLGVSFVDGTRVLLFANSTSSQNLAPGGAASATYSTGGFGGAGWDNPGTIIPPDTSFVIRNNSSEDLTYFAEGLAPDHKVSFMVPGSVNKDTVVGSGYPVPSQVRFSGFGGVDQRRILLFANGSSAQNLAPGGAASATFSSGGFGGAGWDNPGTVLPAGEGYVLRQNGGAGGFFESVPIYPVATD